MLEPMIRTQSEFARSHCAIVAAPATERGTQLGTELAWQIRAWFEPGSEYVLDEVVLLVVERCAASDAIASVWFTVSPSGSLPTKVSSRLRFTSCAMRSIAQWSLA